MCDYSLEAYQSRPAAEGVDMELKRFPSSTMGFTSGPAKTVGPDGKEAIVDCADCVPAGAHLRLSGISERNQRAFGVGPVEDVVMVRLNLPQAHVHRDAVRFRTGRAVPLQNMDAGVTAQLVTMETKLGLDKPIDQAQFADEVDGGSAIVQPAPELVDGD